VNARSALKRLVVALAVAATTACVGAPAQPAPTAAQEVEALIGDAACTSDAECHTIGVGAKSCGGPQAYFPWSSRRTDGVALRQAAQRQAQAELAAAQASGIRSNCAITPDPGASCSPASSSPEAPRQCRLRRAGASATASIF
jgi:hypothetical protein